MTRQFFTEWMNEVFGPGVKKYLQENELPLRPLLVTDNAPAHPARLEDNFQEELSFIAVKFLPPTQLLCSSPWTYRSFPTSKNCTKVLFQGCFAVTSDTQLTLREFWKDHFNIVHCVTLIDEAWCEVSYKTVNSAWKEIMARSCNSKGP